MPPPTTFVDSLQEIILPLLHDPDLSINYAASITGMSTRTLQRYLAQSGITYAQLIDQIRFDRARELMQDANVQLGAIAEALGYANQSYFTRAFKCWSGFSPREFRQTFIAWNQPH